MLRWTHYIFCCAAAATVLSVGCHSGAMSQPPGISQPRGEIVATVSARCYPPQNWSPEPLKSSDRHTHQIWLSPTGHTAYGVAHFNLPIPLSSDIVLFFFLQEMRFHEGEARLLSKQVESSLTRFTAEGGRYTVRAKLVIRGLEGWITYAGTRTDESIVPDELMLAEAARDQTQFVLADR